MSEQANPWVLDENGQSRHGGEQLPHCPCCGYKLDGATSLDTPRTPEPGDLTVCLKCTSILTYEGPAEIKLITTELFEQMLDEPTRNKLQNVAYYIAGGIRVERPLTRIAWHARGWYVLVLFPDHAPTGELKNLVWRTGPYADRAEAEALQRASDPPRCILMVGVRQEAKNKMWGWFSIVEIASLQAQIPLEASDARFYTLAMAKSASKPEALRIAQRYGIPTAGSTVIEVDPSKTPTGQES